MEGTSSSPISKCMRSMALSRNRVVFGLILITTFAFILLSKNILTASGRNALIGPPFALQNGTLIKGILNSLSFAKSTPNNKPLRVLVWVMTMEDNLPTKATAVKETWGRRCDKLLFFSSKTNKDFPSIGLDVKEGRAHLTAKTMGAFRYIYEHHLDEADWFMKADDDTYVVVENLKKFLSNYSSEEPIFFGHHFKITVKNGYYSGGGGYVVSKEALRRFGKTAINSTVCKQDGNDEDVDWGLCMENLGVKSSHSLDENGKTLFHPLAPDVYFLDRIPKWINKWSSHPLGGPEHISPYAITFHYVTPDQMRFVDNLLYHWKVAGPSIPEKI